MALPEENIESYRKKEKKKGTHVFPKSRKEKSSQISSTKEEKAVRAGSGNEGGQAKGSGKKVIHLKTSRTKANPPPSRKGTHSQGQRTKISIQAWVEFQTKKQVKTGGKGEESSPKEVKKTYKGRRGKKRGTAGGNTTTRENRGGSETAGPNRLE